MGIRFAVASPADEPGIRDLLKDAGLPYKDFAGHLSSFITAKDGHLLVGVIGMEICGPDALVRSFAVAPPFRLKGIGAGLYGRLERRALALEVRTLYLLTRTAEDFFARRGYHTILRNDAPVALQNTLEFSTLCPSEAVCMKKKIRQAHW